MHFRLEISNGICSFGVIRNQSVEKRSKTLSCCVKLCIIWEGVMTPLKQARKELKANGYVLKRRGANHDIYFNNQKRKAIPLKRHDFNENDLNYIRKEM